MKGMDKMFKKIISLMLVVCMVLALGVSVSAEEQGVLYLKATDGKNVGEIYVIVAIKDNPVGVDEDESGTMEEAEYKGMTAFALGVEYNTEKFELSALRKIGKDEGGYTVNKAAAKSVWSCAGGLYLVNDDGIAEGIADHDLVQYTFKIKTSNVTIEDYGKEFEFKFTGSSNVTGAAIDFSPIQYVMPDLRPEMEGLSLSDKTEEYSGFEIVIPEVEGAPEGATTTYEITKDGKTVSEIKNAGEYIVTAKTEADGYKPSTLTARVTVNKKPITITVSDEVMFYGEELPEFKTDAPEEVYVEFSVPEITEAGKYSINATATSENYEVTIIPGTLTVYKPEIYTTVTKGTSNDQVFVDVYIKDNIAPVDENKDGYISEDEVNGLTAYQLIMNYDKDKFTLKRITKGDKYEGSVTANASKGIAVWTDPSGLVKSVLDEETDETVVEGYENAHLLRYVFSVNLENVAETDYGTEVEFALDESSNTAFYEGLAYVNCASAKYAIPKLSYTYKFVDEDGEIIKEAVAKHGSVIEAPEAPTKASTAQYTYTFSKWEGYTKDMKITDDVTFTAVYDATINQYTYKFLNEDGSVYHEVTADYGSVIKLPENPSKEATDKYTYKFSQWNGYTEGMTVTGNVEFVAVFEENYIPYIEFEGETSVEAGEALTQKVIFVLPEDVGEIVCQIIYPEEFAVKEITPKEFKYATQKALETKDGMNYLTVICKYDDSAVLKANTIVCPFEITFEVKANAELKAYELNFGEGAFEIVRNAEITVLPKLADSIVITGEDEIYEASTYVATVLPDYTANKEVVWSIDDDSKATITQDGVLTPIKNGVVTIKAQAVDGSEVFGTKTVKVYKECSIDNIAIENSVWNKEFNADVKEYTIYVAAGTTSIQIATEFEGGAVKYNGVELEKNAQIAIAEDATTIILERVHPDYLSRTYTIEVVRTPEETKAEIKEDENKKEIQFELPVEMLEHDEVFMVVTYKTQKGDVNVNGKTINNDSNKVATEIKKEEAIKECKVLFWESLANLKPVYKPVEKEF